MANYYHEARKQVQALKKTTEDNRRRAERRQELAVIDVNTPSAAPVLQSLAVLILKVTPCCAQAETTVSGIRIDGRSSRLWKNQDAYAAAEAREGMIPWSGDVDNLIDRFDGRALLDMYQDPAGPDRRQKSDSELELDKVSLSMLPATAHSFYNVWRHLQCTFYTTGVCHLS